jgi:hypothetical protein
MGRVHVPNYFLKFNVLYSVRFGLLICACIWIINLIYILCNTKIILLKSITTKVSNGIFYNIYLMLSW